MFNLFVYILVILFGSSSWLSTNAVWMELSLFTMVSPEGWTLPSYLAVVVQVACIGPLIYSVLHKWARINFYKAPLILIMLIFCSICMLVLAFTWEKTILIFDVERSFALITLTFLMAIVNATSNVLFLPYMSTFHHTYLTAYFVGMSLSSLVPSTIKLIQGASSITKCRQQTDGSIIYQTSEFNLLFHVREYMLIMFFWLCLSSISFVVLHWFSSDNVRRNQNEIVAEQKHLNSKDGKRKGHSCEEASSGKDTSDTKRPVRSHQLNLATTSNETNNEIPANCTERLDGTCRYYILIACLAIICAQMNTIVPSIQSYAALPYSLTTYHLALTLNNLSHPIANFLPLWLKPKRLSTLLICTFLCSALVALIFILALQSPRPVFSSLKYGGILPVTASIVFGFMASYLRTHITGLLRSEHHDDESRLFWCGLFMQIGSFIGAFLMFPLVNVWNVFKSVEPPICT